VETFLHNTKPGAREPWGQASTWGSHMVF